LRTEPKLTQNKTDQNASAHFIRNMPTELDQKIQALKDLGTLRKRSCYSGYLPISHFHDGKYESQFVSPYTNSAANADSWIVVILQDWSSEVSLARHFDAETAKIGHTPRIPTNRNLKAMLKIVFSLSLEQIFVTNVFPFIKRGLMSSPIPSNDMNKAFSDFCLPQIRIVRPRLVVCCGRQVYESAQNYFKMFREKIQPVGNYFETNGVMYYHQRHTGAIATNTNGGLNTAISNWRKMKETFENRQNGA
jgi:hypothetical protein